MQFIATAASFISGLGKYVMIPIAVSLIGIVFRADTARAIKGGITVGIGLMGLDLALSLVGTYLGPVGTALVAKAGLNLDVIDVGWTALSGIAYSTQIGAFIIPYMVLFNIVLLAIGATKTIDIDIWNYWHAALVGSLMATITGNIIYGFVAATAFQMVSFAIADRTAEDVQEVLGLPGISIPHAGAITAFSIGYIMEAAYNKIGLFGSGKQGDASTAKKLTENKLINTLKDPVFVGYILGIVVGFASGQSFKTTMTTALAMSALLMLTPRMVKILMEGLVPISQAAQKMMNKRFKGQQLYIGMDTAVGLGHVTTMIGTVVMIPIVILLCAILPGNRILPVASLASCGYNCAMINVCHKGNLPRVLLTTSISICFFLIASSVMAPIVTNVALSAGYQTEYALITSISGDLLNTTFFYVMFSISPIVGVAVSAAMIIGLILLQRNYLKKKAEFSTREFIDADKNSYVNK